MTWTDSEFASDDLHDREFPDEDDESDEAEVVACQECGEVVYEEAVQCPYCGCYLSSDTSVWSGRPKWWIGLALLGIMAAVFGLAFVF